MMSVLVTGATTPIGERLVRSLIADTRVARVLAVGEEPPDRALPFSHGERLKYLQVDLTRSRRVHRLLFGPAREAGVEVVIHLAQHRQAYARGKRVHAQNVEALRSILDLSHRHPTIRRVVLKSYAEVYKIEINLPVLITEDHPLELMADAQYIRDRVEADLTACARMGLIDAEIVVLRTAEALGPGTGSQLFDYLDAPLAVRPAGYDPMVNVATIADIVSAVEKATFGFGEGVFNVPGFDTLPLSAAIDKWGTRQVSAPGMLMRPLYRLRHRIEGSDFSYSVNRRRMHLGLVLDGTRARKELGYIPQHPVNWPMGGPVSIDLESPNS